MRSRWITLLPAVCSCRQYSLMKWLTPYAFSAPRCNLVPLWHGTLSRHCQRTNKACQSKLSLKSMWHESRWHLKHVFMPCLFLVISNLLDVFFCCSAGSQWCPQIWIKPPQRVIRGWKIHAKVKTFCLYMPSINLTFFCHFVPKAGLLLLIKPKTINQKHLITYKYELKLN